MSATRHLHPVRAPSVTYGVRSKATVVRVNGTLVVEAFVAVLATVDLAGRKLPLHCPGALHRSPSHRRPTIPPLTVLPEGKISVLLHGLSCLAKQAPLSDHSLLVSVSYVLNTPHTNIISKHFIKVLKILVSMTNATYVLVISS